MTEQYFRIGLVRQLSPFFETTLIKAIGIHIQAMRLSTSRSLQATIDLIVGHADQLPPRFNSRLLEDPLVLW